MIKTKNFDDGSIELIDPATVNTDNEYVQKQDKSMIALIEQINRA